MSQEMDFNNVEVKQQPDLTPVLPQPRRFFFPHISLEYGPMYPNLSGPRWSGKPDSLPVKVQISLSILLVLGLLGVGILMRLVLSPATAALFTPAPGLSEPISRPAAVVGSFMMAGNSFLRPRTPTDSLILAICSIDPRNSICCRKAIVPDRKSDETLYCFCPLPNDSMPGEVTQVSVGKVWKTSEQIYFCDQWFSLDRA